MHFVFIVKESDCDEEVAPHVEKTSESVDASQNCIETMPEQTNSPGSKELVYGAFF